MVEFDPTKEYTPDEYFRIIKNSRQEITDDELQKIYDNCLELLNKYKITGQRKGAQKLLFHLSCIEKEREIVASGVNTFIYRDDIEEYIDHIAKDVVKIIELENYEREIPDEIVHVVEDVGGKFDRLYVLFTDYTGKVERQIQRERRSTDPILFGTFQNPGSRLGDWEDEFCDLTLDKMVGEVKSIRKRDITHTIKTPEDLEELKQQLGNLQSVTTGRENAVSFKVSDNEKKSFFRNIKSFFMKR